MPRQIEVPRTPTLPAIRRPAAIAAVFLAAAMPVFVVAAEPAATSTDWRNDEANLEIVSKLNRAAARMPFSREFEGVLDACPFVLHWTIGPNLPVAWKGGVAGVIDGRIILTGGLWMPDRLNLTYAFDPGTGTYAELPAPPITPQYTQGACDGTSLYVPGGRGSARCVLRLTRSRNGEWAWNEMAALPAAEGAGRWLATAAIDPGRWLYLLAGTPTGAPSEVGEKPQLADYRLPLDRADAEWEPIAPYPGGARSLVMGTVVDGRLYVFGGSLNDPEMRAIHVELSTQYGLRAPYNGVPNHRDAYCYDPAADVWRRLRSTPFPVIAGTALPVDDQHILLMGSADFPTLRVGKSQEHVGIRVKGGASGTHWRGYGDRILCYHIAEDNYSHVGVMPYGVATSHWVLHGGRVYSFGGEPAHGFNLNTENVLQIGTLRRGGESPE